MDPTQPPAPESSRTPPPNAEALPIHQRWTDLLLWLLPQTDHFPRKVRFTLTTRIDNLALDVLDDLTIAAYTGPGKREVLDRTNLRLTRLRVMLRMARDLGHMPRGKHEDALRAIDTVGRMLGGWRRSL